MNGILFKPAMIQAIVEGRKTVTRRLHGLKEVNQNPNEWRCNGWLRDGFYFEIPQTTTCHLLIKPRYKVGETVYIKEAYYACGHWDHLEEGWCFDMEEDSPIIFADEKQLVEGLEVIRGFSKEEGWYKRSPMFLPADWARHFIKILDVRPERLQEIIPEDCVAEGINDDRAFWDDADKIERYRKLWDSINPKHPWARNEWILRYEFEPKEMPR